jgi:hypothetical protein
VAGEVEPAYALLDYHLPDGTGHRLAQSLSARLPRLTTVLMSADPGAALPDLAGLAEPLPARGFVQKPIRLAQIDSLFGTPAQDPGTSCAAGEMR